ncbi:MAG: Tad domain-containing protein [Anaerolineae bacterium]|nr:Tad domain-containing protein [Anaerolineae bacterium]MCB0222287.1 Tad domain-containing protein [Anaerolineae bacterium]MCB9103837.1 Tad domain-containing protein [Anaerolineales bacterium]
MKRVFRLLPNDEKGQSIVVVTLLLSFVFLAFAAATVDGTIVYLHRRQLQNIADSAALSTAVALAQGKTEAEAYQKAMDTIATNEGEIEWYSTDLANPDPPNTNVGTGQDLTLGIEITDGCDVRVALQWSDIGTYFAQFVGRELLQVGANARAGCNRSGGLMPIAVKRFGDERDWNPNLTNTNSAVVYCDDCSTQQSLTGAPAQGLGNATDFLRPSGSDEITEWPGWPGGPEMYQSPSPHAELSAGAPGRNYFILGGGVNPNVGTVSYAGLVNLDIRHVSAPPVEYYNGVSAGTQSNVLKDLGEYYIRRGYCCDIPSPGDQVAMYNGNSTSFSAQAFQQTYAISDVVAVIVYNGHVFNTPNLAVTGETPYYKSTRPLTTTTAGLDAAALTYAIDLEAEDGFQSAAGGLTMSVIGLNNFADWSFSPTDAPVLGRNGINQRTITLHITPTVTTVGTTTHVITGTRMFYVSVIDNRVGGTNIRRYWGGMVTVGDEVNGVQRDLPAVTGLPTNSAQNYPFLSVVKGKQAKYSIDLDLWAGAAGQSVSVNFVGTLPTGFSWVSSPPWTKNTNTNHPGASFNLNIKVDSSATANTIYTLPFLVSAGTKTQTFDLYVLVEEAETTVKDYVEILGYAALEITGYYNGPNLIDPSSPQPANAVRGRIVSELMTDPSDLKYGLRARLIPW